MTYPTGYTLDDDFTLGVLPSGWTLTRASTATDSFFTDAAGSGYNTYANNAPRFSGAAGMVVESQARTNYLLNSTAPATQTTGSLPAGPSNYCLWVIGTGSATVAAGTAVGTGFGTATAGNPIIFNVTTAGTVVVTVTGSLNRFQLERGGSPTSFIVTAGATATRAAETLTKPVGAWFTQSIGTLLAVGTEPLVNATSQVYGWIEFNDGTTSNAIRVTAQPLGTGNLIVATTTTLNVGVAGTSIVANTPHRVAMRYNGTTQNAKVASQGVLSNQQTGRAVPTGITQLNFPIGTAAATVIGTTGRLLRVQYWPFELSDADLISATTEPPIGAPFAQSSAGAATAAGQGLSSSLASISATGKAIPAGTAVVPITLRPHGIAPTGGVGTPDVEIAVPSLVAPGIAYPTSETFIPSDVASYLDRIPRWNRAHPNFVANVYLLCAAGTVLTQFLQQLTTTFDVDTAIGVQLDQIGQWVGRSRRINNPITDVYFSWDTANLGWDEGVWLGPFDPIEGMVSLDDHTYRLLLKAKIGANSWDSTIGEMQDIMAPIVATSPGTLFYVQDNQDMTMTMAIAGKLPPLVTQSLILGGYIPFKPEGVRVDEFITSVDNTALFGFDGENSYIAGWDVGAWGVTVKMGDVSVMSS